MTTSDALDNLRSRILSHYTLLFLRTWEEDRWESQIAELALEMERGLVTWTITTGTQPALGPETEGPFQPLDFLDQVEAFPEDHVFFVKDFHPYFQDPRVVRRLRDLVSHLNQQNKTLLFVGPINDIPLELQKEAIPLDLPLPGAEELRDVLAEALADLGRAGQT
jgi:hypothetical protein